MPVLVDNPTRFFTVVGAPYVPERHYDVGSDLEPRGYPTVPTAASQDGSTGWWLQDEC